MCYSLLTTLFTHARLKALLKDKLIEIGWHERLKTECEAEIRKRGIDSIGAQEIVDYTTERARGTTNKDLYFYFAS